MERKTLAKETALEGGIDLYISSLIHQWSKTLTAFGFILIPMFFILDLFVVPPNLLARFAFYRFAAALIIFLQYCVIFYTKSSRYSRAHGYFFSTIFSLMTTAMTCEVGGFNSGYYAGLSLVIVATNILLPWEVVHSIINSVIVISMYLIVNLFLGEEYAIPNLVNNLYFLTATAAIAVSINYVKQKIVRQDATLRAQLEEARDALWTEMEVAKRIQTALLPNERQAGSYEVAALMVPAIEVGGDYYDIIESRAGETWIAIGDASGHGVESGLIMMMTQTSVFTTVNQQPGASPSSVLTNVNAVIKENLNRLGTDRYMTIVVLRLDDYGFVFSGKHQDIFVHRARKGVTELIPSKGTWLGVIESIGEYLHDTHVRVDEGDVILLFTDGVTEATSSSGLMFGERALERTLAQNAHRSASDIVLAISEAVIAHLSEQRDDYTIIVLKRKDTASSAAY